MATPSAPTCVRYVPESHDVHHMYPAAKELLYGTESGARVRLCVCVRGLHQRNGPPPVSGRKAQQGGRLGTSSGLCVTLVCARWCSHPSGRLGSAGAQLPGASDASRPVGQARKWASGRSLSPSFRVGGPCEWGRLAGLSEPHQEEPGSQAAGWARQSVRACASLGLPACVCAGTAVQLLLEMGVARQGFTLPNPKKLGAINAIYSGRVCVLLGGALHHPGQAARISSEDEADGAEQGRRLLILTLRSAFAQVAAAHTRAHVVAAVQPQPHSQEEQPGGELCELG